LSSEFRCEVVTRASAELAWEVFSNLRRWHTFSNVYGSLEWVQGTPWTEGSRLRIEIVQPLPMVIDHVITYCDPGRKVGWIDNASGAVMEQWVTFSALPDGNTRILLVGEIVGGDAFKIAGKSATTIMQEFSRGWYENFRTVCDALSPVAA